MLISNIKKYLRNEVKPVLLGECGNGWNDLVDSFITDEIKRLKVCGDENYSAIETYIAHLAMDIAPSWQANYEYERQYSWPKSLKDILKENFDFQC